MKAILFALALFPTLLMAETPMKVLVVDKFGVAVSQDLKKSLPEISLEKAHDSDSALQKIEKWSPDVVIIAGDLAATHGLTGWQLLAAIQKEFPKQKVLYMSRVMPSVMEKKVKSARAKPPQEYLQKPCTSSDVAKAVLRLYEKSPTQRTAAR